jgi:hypothetical protein
METFQLIQILLAEYNTLRAELLSRYTAHFSRAELQLSFSLAS